MKKIEIFAGIILGLLLSSVVSLAQEELPQAGITPDSWLYGLERAWERIRMAFTFAPEGKIRLHLQFANERLAEAREMIRKGKPEFVLDLMKAHEIELNETEKEIERVKALGRNVTALVEHVSNVTYKHILVLEEVLERVPEQAKPAIEHAMNVSLKGHETAISRLSEDFPEKAAEYRMRFTERWLERIQTRAKEGKSEEAEELVEEYEEYMNKSLDLINKTERIGGNATALAEHICSMIYKHVAVLERVLDKVPEEAEPVIEKAINASIKRHEDCVERMLIILNKSEERFKWKNCTSDQDCQGLFYCPTEFGFETTCYIPPNKTTGVCHCWPIWRKLQINCTVDSDCRNINCPKILGNDTALCKERKCICGAKWEIVNATEWKERFNETLTQETQRRMETIRKMIGK